METLKHRLHLRIHKILDRICRPLTYLYWRVRTHTRKIHIVFLMQNIAVLDTWHSVIEACSKNPNMRVTVLAGYLIDGRSETTKASPQERCMEMQHALAALGIASIPLLVKGLRNMPSLKALKADALFVQTPYLDHRPPAYSDEAIAKESRLCYIPYGFMLAKHDFYQCGLAFYDSCWRIFVECEMRRHAFTVRKGANFAEHVVVSGMPKNDLLTAPAADSEYYWNLPRSAGVKRVIWAPHWTFAWENEGDVTEGYSQFHVYAEAMLELARTRPNLDLVLRPHPLLWWAVVENKKMTQAQVDAYHAAFEALPNARIDKDGNYLAAFSASDALITDGVSFLGEYLPTLKPVLYTENLQGPGLNSWGDQIVAPYWRAHDVSDLKVFMESVVFGGADDRRAAREAAMKEAMFLPAGGAGHFITQTLEKELRHG